MGDVNINHEIHGIYICALRVVEFHIKTIEDLANWKYFKIARALVALKATEVKGLTAN